MSPESRKLRVAAVGDLHVQEHTYQPFRDLFAQISESADILLLTGDLTNTGLPKEAENLAQSLQTLRIPVVGVLGNHDHHSNQVDEIKKILSEAKFKFLDDEVFETGGVGFAGVKGFGGGFGNHMLGFFGEEATKEFVTEAVNEALRLENSLKRLEAERQVVVLHYAPVRATVEGEPLEIHPYMGCSRFAEVIDRFDQIKLVVHGHSHHGSFMGQTGKNTPVYNVTYEIMKRTNPVHPFLLMEI